MSATSPVVLIVEDHQDSLTMYALGLLAMGLQPVTAANAEEGFRRACEFHPDVVVTDVRMPGTSGLQLARQLRDDCRTRDAGIIAITSDESVKREAAEAGCDRFLVKPCPPDTLAREIFEVLGSRDTHGSGARGPMSHEPPTGVPSAIAHVPSYQQAFERIRADYQEMPGMRLTAEQVQRLCGVDGPVCRQVLDDLVRAQFLQQGTDGRYVRAADVVSVGPGTETAGWTSGDASSASYRMR